MLFQGFEEFQKVSDLFFGHMFFLAAGAFQSRLAHPAVHHRLPLLSGLAFHHCKRDLTLITTLEQML